MDADGFGDFGLGGGPEKVKDSTTGLQCKWKGADALVGSGIGFDCCDTIHKEI